mgnify:CR=1 FL=1
MNLPNKLTILRVIMIPFFVLTLLYDGGENQTLRYVAAAIFIIASLTDMLDGKIARKYNLVTNFGNLIADRIMNLIEVLPISIRLLLLTLMERFMWLSGITLLLQTKISRPVFMLLQVVRMEVRRNGLLRLGLSRVCVHSVLRWLQTDT